MKNGNILPKEIVHFKSFLFVFLAVLLVLASAFNQVLYGQATPEILMNEYHLKHNKIREEGHKKIRAYSKEIEDQYWLNWTKVRDNAKSSFIKAPLPLNTEETYANGQIKGRWNVNHVTNLKETSGYGYGYGAGVRLDRTVYDGVNNRVYALNTSSNLMDGKLEDKGSLIMRNQVVKLEKKGFTGVNLTNGDFRLVAVIYDKFYYSDDHGLNWTASQNGELDPRKVEWVERMDNGHIMALIKRNNIEILLKSTDRGNSFDVVMSWPIRSERILATKLYNSNDNCVIIRKNHGQNMWYLYRYLNGVLNLEDSLNTGKKPNSISATLVNGTKLYVSCDGGGGYFYDGLNQWNWLPNMPHRIQTIGPLDYNTIISHEATHNYSIDGGKTWQSYVPNSIGWDPKHLTFYKVNGIWTLVVANDMGLGFTTQTIQLDPKKWKQVNNDHSYAILHGGASADHTALTVTGNQDPGTYEFIKKGEDTFDAYNPIGADGLRVAIANDGESYWYRHYWESFYHSNAKFTGRTSSVSRNGDLTSFWYTPPFKGSTKIGEDAIYISGYDKLQKMTYNSGSNSISRKEFLFNFKTMSGDVTWGVGVAKTDPNRIYVSTRNGDFYYSKDTGQTWTKTKYTGPKPMSVGVSHNQSTGMYIEVADKDADIIYWGSSYGNKDGACLISYDGGETFTSHTSGLPSNERVGNVSLSPDGKFAFSNTGYVFVQADDLWYDLKGDSWPTGAVGNGVNYLPLQNKVRYFTWGAGVVDFDITHFDATDHAVVSFDETKCYRIFSPHSLKVVGVKGGSMANNANIEQSSWQKQDYQKWTIKEKEGFFTFINFATGKALEVSGGSLIDGGNVVQNPINGSEEQQWNVVDNLDGTYSIASKNSVKALSIANGSKSDGANIEQWTTHFEAHRTFKIAPVVCTTVGISDLDLSNSLSIYPNPATNILAIDLGSYSPAIEPVYLSVNNLLGENIIGEKLLEKSTTEFDISDLVDGTYLIKIKSGDEFLVKKFIKMSHLD